MDHDTLPFAMSAKPYPNLNAETLDLWDRLFKMSITMITTVGLVDIHMTTCRSILGQK